MPELRSLVHFVLLVLPAVASLAAQTGLPDHADRISIPGQTGHSMAYDVARERVVLFGAGGTWEWDGATWETRSPSGAPAAFGHQAMAYDVARRCTLLFGTDGTWEWDGADWRQRQPAHEPPPRFGASMAYDVARQRVVLFGGQAPNAALGDTWEWDGNDWQQRAPVHSPPARRRAAMAYDVARGRTVLFGGFGLLGDTWEWDGVDWHRRDTAHEPLLFMDYGMAYDLRRQTCVLYGDDDCGHSTWEYDGVDWRLRSVATEPGLVGARLAYDIARDEIVSFGGARALSYRPVRTARTWIWDGVDWRLRHVGDGYTDSARMVAYDTRRSVLVSRSTENVHFDGSPFGSQLPGTREWDGSTWRVVAAGPVSPGGAMAFDAARGHCVLFGGVERGVGTFYLDTTWTWDGTSWQRLTLGASPPGRADHALAFDGSRGRVVLFGGRNHQSSLSDTWEWDGSTWTALQPDASPTARSGHAMAHDPLTGRTVLYGGRDAAGNELAETWIWDGAIWQELLGNAPVAAADHAMAWDPDRQRIVLYVGDALWQLDGNTWARIQTARPLPQANGGAMVFDARRRALVVVGGDTTRLIGSVTAARVETLGVGCPTSGSASPPRLQATAPRIGATELRIAVDDAPVDAPTVIGLSVIRTPIRITPGCTFQLGSPMALFARTSSGFGHAEIGVPLPPLLSLSGSSFFAQAAIIDASTGGPTDLALSPALALRTGY